MNVKSDQILDYNMKINIIFKICKLYNLICIFIIIYYYFISMIYVYKILDIVDFI